MDQHDMQSEKIGELAKALAAAQAEFKGAIKDSTNPFFKANYADLESVWAAIRAPLAKQGLAIVQTTEKRETEFFLVTTLVHGSGEWIRGFYPLHPVKDDPQGFGSCVSYARRYALAAMVGVYQTDDDAEGAMRRQQAPARSPQQPRPAPVQQPRPPTGYDGTAAPGNENFAAARAGIPGFNKLGGPDKK